MEFLNSIDLWLFHFINSTLSNPVFDNLMPFLTEANHWFLLFAYFIVVLLVSGGKEGRYLLLILAITILITDQTDNMIKNLIMRPRPCHVLQNIHMLVSCGPGKSMPSSHAANFTAGAVILSHYFKKFRWIFYSLAGIICFSRIYVGVHYPFDTLVGAALGIALAAIIIFLKNYFVWKSKMNATSQQ
jgi:membrane-associated phospholipid phosphatase